MQIAAAHLHHVTDDYLNAQTHRCMPKMIEWAKACDGLLTEPREEATVVLAHLESHYFAHFCNMLQLHITAGTSHSDTPILRYLCM